MIRSVKLIASEALMCGLKSIPVVGKAFEVIDAVQGRHEMLAQAEQLAAIEANLSRIERRMRDLVEDEIRSSLARLGRSRLDGRALSDEIRNLWQIREQGWEPTLFEGLLLRSRHLESLRRNPQHYGRVLDRHDETDPDTLRVLIDADPLRILELHPFALASLLGDQEEGVPPARIEAPADIWAFPGPADWQGTTPGELRVLDCLGQALRLRWCPPGRFAMGSPADEPGREPSESPVTVTLGLGFWLLESPVTNAQWLALMGTTPSEFQHAPGLPFEQVSWDDATRFCDRATALLRESGQLPPGWAIGLPTEARWEYAARAGTSTRFPTGPDDRGLADHAWFDANAAGSTHEVGSKAPNGWGFHDLLGNVWEWCADSFSPTLPGGLDPVVSAVGDHRAIRGGGWSSGPDACRPSSRSGMIASLSFYTVGFRIAAAPVPAD